MFLFGMRQRARRCCSCPHRLPISHQWMSATNQNIDYPKCKAKNCWCSVDAHSQNGAVTMLMSLLPTKAAITSFMPNSDQITIQLPYLQDQKLLRLCWRWFSEWGSDRVAGSLHIKSANTSVLANSYQITIQFPYLQDQKSLTLHWHSFLEWGSHRIAISFA